MTDTVRTRAQLLAMFADNHVGAISPQSLRDMIVSVYSSTSDIKNVVDYGATGDGTTDDSAAVQAAVDDLSTLGGTVYFPPGIYKLQSSIVLPDKHIQLLGAGWASQITGDASSLIKAPQSPLQLTGGQVIVRSLRFNCTKTASSQRLLDITVDYLAGNQSLPFYVEGCYFFMEGHMDSVGIYCFGISDGGIHNCYFLSDGAREIALGTFRGTGIYIFAEAGTASLNVEISGCEFLTLEKGIVIDSSDGAVEGIRIEDCSFVGCQLENVEITGGGGLLVQIIGCMIDSTHGNGIDIANADSIYIMGNWIAPNQDGLAGISVTSVTNAVTRLMIIGNEFSSGGAGSPGNAIALDSTGNAMKYVLIHSNIFEEWSSGIICGGAGISFLSVMGNLFSGITNAIDLGGVVTDYLIEHNLFETVTNQVVNAAKWALKVLWSSSVGGNNVRFSVSFDEYPLAGASLTSLLLANQTEAAPGSANTTKVSTFTFTTNPTTGAIRIQLIRLGSDGADTNTGVVSVWEQWLQSPSGQKVFLRHMDNPALAVDAHGSLVASHFDMPDVATTYLNFSHHPVDAIN